MTKDVSLLQYAAGLLRVYRLSSSGNRLGASGEGQVPMADLLNGASKNVEGIAWPNL